MDADVDADVDADGGASRTVEERERVKVEGCTLGLVEGNRLARAANANAFLDAASLPKETKAKLRARLGRWARAVGNAKESMVYLLSLDRLGNKAEDDEMQRIEEVKSTAWTFRLAAALLAVLLSPLFAAAAARNGSKASVVVAGAADDDGGLGSRHSAIANLPRARCQITFLRLTGAWQFYM